MQQRDGQDHDDSARHAERLSMGPPDLHDYTIQTDFKALAANGKLPDVGLIAQGYTLEVSGGNRWLN